MKRLSLLIFSAGVFLMGCKNHGEEQSANIISHGQMPNMVRDGSGALHLVFGAGDSLMYSYSVDDGESFSAPALIAILPKLAAAAMRGPQIAASDQGLIVTACNHSGDIFSFTRGKSNGWARSSRVNDMDTVAKEGLMALGADGDLSFAVWLDLRNKHNMIYGARSMDGGKTWSKNFLVYESPDSSVCECCKPSVAIQGKHIYIMFRNRLNGNRDLYLMHSSDGGLVFGPAQKLGKGSWALDACPMDGGGLALDKDGNPITAWNREGTVYASMPGKEESPLGQGRNCTIEFASGNNIYAWAEKGDIIVVEPNGQRQYLGKGQLPIIKAAGNDRILCVWENEKQIHKAVLNLRF